MTLEPHAILVTALIRQNIVVRTCGIDDPIDSDKEERQRHGIFDLDDTLADLFEGGNDRHHRIGTPDKKEKQKRKKKHASKIHVGSTLLIMCNTYTCTVRSLV